MNSRHLLLHWSFISFVALSIATDDMKAADDDSKVPTTELHTVSTYSRQKGVTLVQPYPTPVGGKTKKTTASDVHLGNTIEVQVDFLADCLKEIKGTDVKTSADADRRANAKATEVAIEAEHAKGALGKLEAAANSLGDSISDAARQALPEARKKADGLQRAVKRANRDKEDDALAEQEIPNLVLFINNSPIKNLHVQSWLKDNPDWHQEMSEDEKEIPRHYLRFELLRDTESKKDWDRVLRAPGDWCCPIVDVGVGYHNSNNTADQIPTWVRSAEDHANQIKFLRIPADPWLVAGLMLLIAALLVFGYCAWKYDILRDPTQPVRKDGLRPVSLARCQMAFWFFLVAAAFFFLWLVTGRGDINTLNQKVLALIGISTFTAVGATAIEGARGSGSGNSDKKEQDNREETYPEKIANAKNRLAEAQKNLESAGSSEKEAAKSPVKEAEQALSKLEHEFRSYRTKHRYRFLFDLLSESFDEDHPVLALHRFQIIVWTLILGVVFVSDVWNKLRMTEFEDNLLLLTGISSLTYLTFKLTPTQKDR
jgi:hypothetical protein